MLKRKIALAMAGFMAVSAFPMNVMAEENGDKVNLTVMCAYASEDPHGQYVYQYADKFMEENPNVNIEIQAVSSNDIYTKLAAMATSPDDLPTLFFTSADQAPTLYDLGLMEDLKGYLDDETLGAFANGVVDACTYDDTMAFYPIDVQPLAMLYRTDRFEEKGLEVPKTWDEFLECAKALTEDSDGDGEWVADLGDNFTDLLKFWTDMNNEYGVVPTGITEVDYATAANYFAMGYTSMMLTGSNAIGVAYANNEELKGKIGSFPIPGDAAGTMLNAEGYALCSSASDEQKTAAVDFLKFFTNNDSDLMFWQSSGKIPATTEAQKAEYITGDDYKGYLQTIENGCIAPTTFAGISGLKSLLGDAYSSVFSGEATNEEAADTFASELDNLLEDYN